ncbi:phosphotransferase enzyme family protein [Nonomuraea basaltis]|uniref:phosphotransferase enzyme family protein n=1 Tax=Nonomuraea basaltis TaxID=2495887 RepID=UPI00110C4C1B|nr:phosphotransferase [Nonomuraea basaltis]TMR88980.1 aminoglycoside phosphotransferase [Nonomuraea basaltis]
MRHIEQMVAQSYGLSPGALRRFPDGQSTINYVDGRGLFVKVYRDADLARERAAIALSRFAAEGGLPTAPIIPTRAGELIAVGDGIALSVWRYVDGHTVEGLSAARLSAIGTVTGRLHRHLLTHPAGGAFTGPSAAARLIDIGRAEQQIDALIELNARAGGGDFTAWADTALHRQRALLPEVARLATDLPVLTSQVIHGDLATPNVLFAGDRVAALVDFRPPTPWPVIYEIARIACDPHTALSDAWLTGLAAFVTSYRAAHPQGPADDLLACVRFWICYTSVSPYPLRRLLHGRALLPNPLKAYARIRHDALQSVLERFEEAEAVVHQAVAAAAAFR